MILYHMSSVNDKISEKKYDVMICANGSEGRDTNVVKKLKENNVDVKNWIVFHYREREKNSDGEEGNVIQYLKDEDIGNVMTSYDDSRSYAKILEGQYEILNKSIQIGIDITGFKNQFFFALIKFLYYKLGKEKLDVFYTEPATYKFPKSKSSFSHFPNVMEEASILFNYSKANAGIEIKNIPEFAGTTSKKTVLVIILGFDGKVAVRIKEEYSAEKVILINGFPSYLPKFRDISLLNNKELVLACGKNDIYSTYADNPFEAYNVLKRIKEQYKDYKMLIAPLGAKPLALGACIFAIDYPQVAVLYVESSDYVEKTTEKEGESWRYQLEFIHKKVRNIV